MTQPVQINTEGETIEIPVAEYEAVIQFGVKIADQNALVLKGLDTLRGELVAQAENQTATFASLVDAIKAIQITVNVPEQPAPQVTVNVPNEKRKLSVTRSRSGAIEIEEA